MKIQAKLQQGFTLIELMIVIAIIGILAAIAIPQYQNYTVRAKVSESVSLLDGAKTAVEEFYLSRGSFPATADIDNIGIQTTGKYTTSIALDQANTRIVATLNAIGSSIAATDTIYMTRNNSTNQWTCSSTTVLERFLPAGCSSSAT